MSSTNIDANSLLSYVSNSFKSWKINDISVKVLKDAKENKHEAVIMMKFLLFRLCLLHLLDYEYDMEEIGLAIDV